MKEKEQEIARKREREIWGRREEKIEGESKGVKEEEEAVGESGRKKQWERE